MTLDPESPLPDGYNHMRQATRKLRPRKEIIGMYAQKLQLGPLETNCWIVGAQHEGPLVVIDPAGDFGILWDAIEGREVIAIVLTHGHFDHVGAARELVEATHATLMAHAETAGRANDDGHSGSLGALFGFEGITFPAVLRNLSQGDTVECGSLRMKVLETPGHAEGSICLFAEDPVGGPPHLFAGDTLFAGSVGRTDLPGGDGQTLRRSIAAVLAPLPPSTIVHPGHGPDTTIAREIKLNPFFPRG